jgi:hypothetical protein
MRLEKVPPFHSHAPVFQYPRKPTTEKLRREIDRVIEIYYTVQSSPQGLIVEIRME